MSAHSGAESNATVQGAIDWPTPAAMRSSGIVVSGWCHNHGAPPIRQVRARSAERVFPGRYGIARPDVERHFNGAPHTSHCGFEIPILLNAAATIRLEVSTGDDTWQLLQPLELGAPDRPFCAAIDTPANSPRPDPLATIRGWCALPDGAPAAAVRLRVGDRVWPAIHGIARPDVAAFWSGLLTSERCGYEGSLLLAESGIVAIEALTTDGSWAVVDHLLLASADSPFCASIDSPVSGHSTQTHFILGGWCAHAHGHPVVAIRARIDNATFSGVCGIPRPDVAEALGPYLEASRAGFAIPVVLGPRRTTAVVEAQLSDGSWHRVRAHTVHTTSSLWLDAVRWKRFWLGAWFGRHRVWQDLTEDERDFALLRVKQRGWMNLDALPQHSPYPVRPERFPRRRMREAALPRVGAVTPSFQQAAFLEATIQSIVGQEGVRIDYVVQDGGSTDGSVDVIRRYSGRLHAWESGKDAGQASAIVEGFNKISLAPDDVMFYLNSDDVLLAGAARFVAEYFARHPLVDVVYGHRILIDEDGQEVGRWLTPRRSADDLKMFNWVPQETLFWRKRIWDKVGGIDPTFMFAMDWDLLLRFEEAGAQMARLPWFLAAFRLHPAQKTTARIEEDGIPEMNRLRRRTFGRLPSHEELHLAARRGQVDSALLFPLWQRGWRL